LLVSILTPSDLSRGPESAWKHYRWNKRANNEQVCTPQALGSPTRHQRVRASARTCRTKGTKETSSSCLLGVRHCARQTLVGLFGRGCRERDASYAGRTAFAIAFGWEYQRCCRNDTFCTDGRMASWLHRGG
jgi:hypothetical protein